MKNVEQQEVMVNETLSDRALAYHCEPTPGKLAISVTKPTKTQADLSLAYTPGVAEPVREIAHDPDKAYLYTSKGNLVAVITDGSAVLGLGNVGALASKPVMEGKAVLFKEFAGIDVFDIEVDAPSPQAFIETVAHIAPTFGGINLEDIKAPDCFEIEAALKSRVTIPVFHDDQHGTAITLCAGLLNALEIAQKNLADAHIVCVGAGAAGIASLELLVTLGANREHLRLFDSKGLVHTERTDLNSYKFAFAQQGPPLSLTEALTDSDVFIGLARPNLLTQDMLRRMADNPVVFALSNPDPEIQPELALAARQDIILATGRSDYPNQINNVLCFPYLFRGALDVRATGITREMHLAAIDALREIVHLPILPEVKAAYQLREDLSFGREYIVPKPFDPRLKTRIAARVAEAARVSGVARILE